MIKTKAGKSYWPDTACETLKLFDSFKQSGSSLKFQNFKTTLREKCPNAGKYGLEKSPYLDTFHAVLISLK